jgi:polar amino acid transport system substrate-binding protein
MCCISLVIAQHINQNLTKRNVHVGVVMGMPFAQNINGHYSGISVDIWEKIAKENHWQYTYISLEDDSESALKKLTTNLDVIIGPVSVDSKRLQIVDFTRPFFLSSVNVITRDNKLNFVDVIKRFMSHTTLVALSILGISFMLFIGILHYIEKGRLNEVFTHYYNALTKGIWFHLFRKGVSVPKTFFARLVLTPTAFYSRMATITWLLIAAIIFTTINANYIATMTLSLDDSNDTISSIRQLELARVVGVDGNDNIDIAEQNGIYVTAVKNMDEAISLLKMDKTDAVLCEAPVCIEYLRNHHLPDLKLNPLTIQNNEMAFALKLNSPLKHPIDIGITALQDDDSVIKICKKYVGKIEATRCNM